MSDNGHFINNTRWAMAAKVVSAGLALPFFLIMARSLGSRSFGVFTITMSVLTFARIIGGSGLGPSTGKRLAELGGGSDKTEPGVIVTTGLALQLATTIIVGAILWLTSGLLANYLATSELRVTVKIGAVALFFYGATEFTKASLQGLQRFKGLVAVTAVEFGGKLILAGGPALLGYGVGWALAGYTLALVLSFLTALLILGRAGELLGFFSPVQARQIFSYSLPLILTTTGFVIYTELDNVMIGYYKGAGAAGTYSAALGIARAVPMFLAVPVAQAAAPAVVRLMQAGKLEAGEFVERLLKVVFAFFVPLVTGVIVTAPAILQLLGPRYVEAAGALRVMAFFILSLSVGTVVAAVLDYLGGAPRRAKWMSVSVGANIALNLVLIPRLGGVGAALATAVTHGPYVVNNLVALARKVGFQPQLVIRDFSKVLAAAAVAGSAGLGVANAVDSLPLTLLAGAVLYTGLVYAFGLFSPAEIRQVANTFMLRTVVSVPAGYQPPTTSDQPPASVGS